MYVCSWSMCAYLIELV